MATDLVDEGETQTSTNLSAAELTPMSNGSKSKRIDIQKELTEYRQAMMSMSPTLVETVAIDYEDFNESFLTCGTCLLNGRKTGMYDGGEHTPKLLPCSHTVCLQCLDRIVATFARDTGQFRCPICRELITIPRGGVQALPPSFLVNQLLDLMARQRREVIPKCSTHHNQELLFCETCDTVFCTLCTGGSHKPGDSSNNSSNVDGKSSPSHMANTSNVDHTVIPFSIAIKRMSEILIYKANECRAKLNAASDIVNEEIHRLEHNADAAFERVNARFQTVVDDVEKARQEVLAEVRRTRDEKKKVLEEQLQIIQAEKGKVDTDVKTVQHQVEVRNITKKISDLNCKLDTVSTLSEPRENFYIEYTSNAAADDEAPTRRLLTERLASLGSVKTSTTFPPLCTCTMDTAITHLEMSARVCAVDYRGHPQTRGGDPVTAEVLDDTGSQIPAVINDRDDGSYEIKFTPRRQGTFCLKVLVFGRPIRDCPLFFDVTDHNPPSVSFGCRGTKDKGFVQPCNVAVASADDAVYVVDTGNSRIKKLTRNLDFDGHLTNECLEGRSATGICAGPPDKDTLVVINWRTKTVAEISALDGSTVNSFTHEDFREPIDVALDSATGDILVADNGLGALLVFSTEGELKRTIPGPDGLRKKDHQPVNEKRKFKDLSAVAVAPTGEYLAADGVIHVFSPLGEKQREISVPGVGGTSSAAKGRFGGLACDANGFLLATHSVKKQSFIQVFKYDSGELYSSIDSHGCKMKRPTGLAVMTKERQLVLVDIGFDCVRKYRYF